MHELGLHFQFFEPPAELQWYVRYFWMLRGSASEASPYIHRTLVDGFAEWMHFRQGKFTQQLSQNHHQELPQWCLAAPSDRPAQFISRGPFQVFGTCFYPFTLTALSGISGLELANQMIDGTSLKRLTPDAITDQLANSETPESYFSIWSAFLTQSLPPTDANARSVEATIRQLLTRGIHPKISILADQNHLSVRQFQRKVKHLSGFRPGLIARIGRFQSTLSKAGPTLPSLSQLAHDAGYYDQAHFIEDFKQFSGVSPKAFFQKRSADMAWRQ
ncbi:MAG: DUF6597 domain-containing transcriptional factor [Salibacteraceae bacterium]